jgi:hypothetical protein
MRHKSSRSVLVGLSAAAGAFAAAAMVSAAIAPAAHADDGSEILAAVQADETAAAADFTAASQDFAGGEADWGAGLTEWFQGIDNDLFGIPNDLSVGELDQAYNVPVFPTDTYVFTLPEGITAADAVTDAQTVDTLGNTLETDVGNFQAMGDWTDAALDHGLAQMDLSIIPDEILLVGQLDQLVTLFPGF